MLRSMATPVLPPLAPSRRTAELWHYPILNLDCRRSRAHPPLLGAPMLASLGVYLLWRQISTI